MASSPSEVEASLAAIGTLLVADNLELRLVTPGELREQDVNAQVMDPQAFDRLVENIRKRKALESVPYCAQPNREGPTQIVSGHHRVRAARTAGLKRFPVLVDVAPQTRSEIVARQIAHNTLVGRQDEQVLARMLKDVTTPDDLLATGLDESHLPTAPHSTTNLNTPQVAVEWKMVTLTFLPGQLDDFRALVDALEGHQDLVAVAPVENYEQFAQAMAACGRVTDTRSVATVIATLTAMALAEVEAATDPSESTDG